MRIPGTTFYPAHPSNYTAGRNTAITDFTVHHSAGWEQTLRHLWADPARNASSTLYVSGAVREQYVDTDDTQWTNGNFASNSRSITVEVRGDWRNGYYDQATLNNLEEVMYQCLKIFPHLRLTFHQDVSSVYTLCPADLKHLGYATQCWNNAKARLAPKPAPTPAPVAITYKAITPKRVILHRPANLWNFNFANWNAAQSVASYQAGHVVDVVAEATNSLGGKYYMTAYSYNNGAIRATNGFNVKDVNDLTEPVKEDQKPIDTNPVIPGEGDKPAPVIVDVTPPVIAPNPPTPDPVPTDPVTPTPDPEDPVIVQPTPDPTEPDVITRIKTVAVNATVTFVQAFLATWAATGFNLDKVVLAGAIGGALSLVWNTILKPFAISQGWLKA